MPTEREMAEVYLERAQIAHGWEVMAGQASIATAHAVLALLDYLQQDDEPEPAAYRKDRENLTRIIKAADAHISRLRTRIELLEEQLEGARAALRACDDALNTEMKANNTEPLVVKRSDGTTVPTETTVEERPDGTTLHTASWVE